MGRPLNKRNFGNEGERVYIIANVNDTPASGYITKQKGTNKYKVIVDGDEGFVTLVNKDQADLENGEAIIKLFDADGNSENVSKLCEHRASFYGDGSKQWTYGEAVGETIWNFREPSPPISITILNNLYPNDGVVIGNTKTLTISAESDPETTLYYEWQFMPANDNSWGTLAQFAAGLYSGQGTTSFSFQNVTPFLGGTIRVRIYSTDEIYGGYEVISGYTVLTSQII